MPAERSGSFRRWARSTRDISRLIRRARAEVDVVVVSIFVNPIQFNDQRDLAAYPRDLDHDAAAVHAEHADVLFAPTVEEMYPAGFQTEVRVRDVSKPLEGASRGTAHFDGVATVVTKLFNIVQPTLAYFGQKDAQQVVVIQRMVRDLAIPLEIVVCPTVREPDGLAMSSRNVRLDAEARGRAPAIKRALDAAEALIASGERKASSSRPRHASDLADAGIEAEYCDVVSPIDLEPVETIDGDVLDRDRGARRRRSPDRQRSRRVRRHDIDSRPASASPTSPRPSAPDDRSSWRQGTTSRRRARSTPRAWTSCSSATRRQ